MGFLDDRVALVIGGGSGIGRAVVDRYVQEGAKVGVLEISGAKARELRASYSDDSVIVTEGDATSLADNERAVAAVVSKFGTVTTLVCVVGVFDYFTEIPQLPKEKISEAFDQIFSVNVKSILLAVKASLSELIENRGDIVLTVSNAGFYPGGGGPIYVASKFAVRGLVTELAYELAPHVRVNGVAPGGTITELSGVSALSNEGQQLRDVPDIERLIQGINPLGIVAHPVDHSWCYAFLASRERGPAITGVIINSDGGMGVRGMTRMAGLAD